MNNNAVGLLPVLGRVLWVGVWSLLVLSWPLLRWALSLHLVVLAGKALYYWDTPGTYATVWFSFHFAILVALTYAVTRYSPSSK